MVSNGVTRCVLEELSFGCDCSLLWLTTTPTTKDPALHEAVGTLSPR